jgi:hypothetical protein
MLNIVVNCTNRKALKPEHGLCLINYKTVGFDRVHKSWTENRISSKNQLPAYDMYQGEYWSVVRSLAENSNVRIFVFSAGLGIFDIGTRIPSYGATFTQGSPDSVSEIDCSISAFDANYVWFKMNSKKYRDNNGHLNYTKIFGNAPTIFCLSSSYLQVLSNDLVRFDESTREKIMIVGSKFNGMEGYEYIDTPGKLRLTLGGTLSTVSVRTLSYMLSLVDTDSDPGSLFKSMSDLASAIKSKSEELPKFNRITMQDSEVLNFISTELSINSTCSASTLLRKLRDSGFACEQSRFKKLFHDPRLS